VDGPALTFTPVPATKAGAGRLRSSSPDGRAATAGLPAKNTNPANKMKRRNHPFFLFMGEPPSLELQRTG